jgi:hypothetical protein
MRELADRGAERGVDLGGRRLAKQRLPASMSTASFPHRQNFSTHGRSSISQVQALRGCCNTFQ